LPCEESYSLWWEGAFPWEPIALPSCWCSEWCFIFCFKWCVKYCGERLFLWVFWVWLLCAIVLQYVSSWNVPSQFPIVGRWVPSWHDVSSDLLQINFPAQIFFKYISSRCGTMCPEHILFFFLLIFKSIYTCITNFVMILLCFYFM
jgi:hypothetical protein